MCRGALLAEKVRREKDLDWASTFAIRNRESMRRLSMLYMWYLKYVFVTTSCLTTKMRQRKYQG